MSPLRVTTLALSALAPLLLAAPQAAWAQLATNSHAPVDVTSDQLHVDKNQCMSNFVGNAEALQDTSRLRADSIQTYLKVGAAGHDADGPSCGVLDRMVADGTVYYVTPTQVVKGDHAVYTADDKTIVVTGDVVAAQGKDVIAGAKLVINTDTGQANWVSNVQGRGRPGRVRAVLYPNDANNGQGGASGSEGAQKLAPPVPPPPRHHGT